MGHHHSSYVSLIEEEGHSVVSAYTARALSGTDWRSPPAGFRRSWGSACGPGVIEPRAQSWWPGAFARLTLITIIGIFPAALHPSSVWWLNVSLSRLALSQVIIWRGFSLLLFTQAVSHNMERLGAAKMSFLSGRRPCHGNHTYCVKPEDQRG